MLFIGVLSFFAKAATAQSCDCVQLSGPINSDRTLDQPCYELVGCVRVSAGVTLTVNPGTVILADQHASLTVERGGYLVAQGTSMSPIIFTTNQAPSSRSSGYWKGITIAGDASDNQSGITLSRNCGNITGGGSTDNDSSGVLQYVQIHYAGDEESGDEEVHGLTLISVGSKTVIEHVQVTNSGRNGFAFLGGTVNGRHLTAMDNYQTDFAINYGYRGQLQFLHSNRLDANASVAGGSYALEIFNNTNSGSGYAGTPQTKPVISNFTSIGPGYCGSTPGNNFVAGIRIAKNALASISNSFVGGWPVGFLMEDAATILNANNGNIRFDYSSFYDNADNFASSPGNFDQSGTFCVDDIDDWMIDNSVGCEQLQNQELTTFTGYGSSVCDAHCESGAPDFTLSGTALNNTDFSGDLNTPFFDMVSYQGAFATSGSWPAGWTEWCPLDIDYCPEQLTGSRKNGTLLLYPNPGHNLSYARFSSKTAGSITVQILDRISGRMLRSFTRKVSEGSQEIEIPLNGLPKGTWMVQIHLTDGAILASQLVVE